LKKSETPFGVPRLRIAPRRQGLEALVPREKSVSPMRCAPRARFCRAAALKGQWPNQVRAAGWLGNEQRTRAAGEERRPSSLENWPQLGLVTTATATAATSGVDEEQDGDHDRSEHDAREEHPAHTTPGANPALSVLLMKRGHENHLLFCVCIQRSESRTTLNRYRIASCALSASVFEGQCSGMSPELRPPAPGLRVSSTAAASRCGA